MRQYECWCHVCGGHYISHVHFASGSVHVQNGIDYLVRACNEHTDDEKRKSWDYYSKTGKSFNTGKPSIKRIGF